MAKGNSAASYTLRRLNPFRGVVQVVEIEDARALSLDGLQWEIQVQAAQPEHSWRAANRFEPILRYFRFGNWTAEQGLTRIPLSPILDMDAMWQACQQLLSHLAQQARCIPFVPHDHHELWSLTSEGQPLALLASTPRVEQIPNMESTPWSATALSEHGFYSPPCDASAEDGDNPRRDAARLEKFIRDAGGHPTRLQWFARGQNGEGIALSLNDPLPQSTDRPLPATSFPSFTVRSTWESSQQSALLNDYINWIAPYLLTLPTLSDTERERLEQAARRRASLFAALHRLYPKTINPEHITAARVEMRLREAADG